MFKFFKICSLVFLVLSVSSCDTIHKGIKHRKLDVQTKMSETIFLDPVGDDKKTIFLQIKNTSDKQDIKIEEDLRRSLELKGYKVVSSASKANYMLQANILQVGKNNLDNPLSALNSGMQGAVAGGVTGAVVSNNNQAVAAGVILGGVAGTVADAVVEVVNYSIITDLKISERAAGILVSEKSTLDAKQGTKGSHSSSWERKTGWKQYQTRVISTAKKTNLKFEDALPEIKEGLINAISSLF